MINSLFLIPVLLPLTYEVTLSSSSIATASFFAKSMFNFHDYDHLNIIHGSPMYYVVGEEKVLLDPVKVLGWV